MRTISNINDLHITELVKLRKYFNQRQNEVSSEVGPSESNRPYFNECAEAISFLDKLILVEFKTLKRDGELPEFKTMEQINKFRDDFYNGR